MDGRAVSEPYYTASARAVFASLSALFITCMYWSLPLKTVQELTAEDSDTNNAKITRGYNYIL